MGISNFLKVVLNEKAIKEYGEEVTLADFKDKRIAIDAMNMLYRSLFAVNLKSSSGDLTSHINTTLNLIIKMKKFSVEPIWIFDSIKSHELKKETREKRAKTRKLKVTSKQVNEIKKLLELTGTSYIEVAPGDEAEIAGAQLNINGFCAAVLSSDVDILAVGGTILKPLKGGKYLHIDASKLPISSKDLLKIAVHIGTDFSEGTKGIGPKRAFKLKDSEFTERQQKAYDYMSKPINSKDIKKSFSKPDLPELFKWLKTFDFNVEKIESRMKDF